jgi:hypothetical protein
VGQLAALLVDAIVGVEAASLRATRQWPHITLVARTCFNRELWVQHADCQYDASGASEVLDTVCNVVVKGEQFALPIARALASQRGPATRLDVCVLAV